MPTFHHLTLHIQQYGARHRVLYLLCVTLFFLMLFDGILAYLVPILITDRGFPLSQLGLIIGSSSIVGASFDFFLSKILRTVNVRRLFLSLFALCALFAIVLYGATTVWLFLLAMALWGIYFDLYSFITLNVVSGYTNPSEHASSFGVVQVFVTLSFLIAPLIAASTLDHDVTPAFFIASLALGATIISFFFLWFAMSKQTVVEQNTRLYQRKSFRLEARTWKLLGKLLKGPLTLSFFFHLFASLFWTLSPLYPFDGSPQYTNALLLMSFSLPALLVGWFVGKVTSRFGKKRTAYASLAIGSLLMAVSSLFTQSAPLIVGMLVASFFFALSWPAINGAYADYIVEDPDDEEDIEGLQDFFGNSGYVVGPITIGFLANWIGIPATFTVFGAVGVLVGTALYLKGSHSIVIEQRDHQEGMVSRA